MTWRKNGRIFPITVNLHAYSGGQIKIHKRTHAPFYGEKILILTFKKCSYAKVNLRLNKAIFPTFQWPFSRPLA